MIRKWIGKFSRGVKHLLHNTGLKKYYYWEGIYNNFNEVLIQKPGFESNIIEQRNINYTKALFENASCTFVPHGSSGDDTLLPLLISVISRKKEPVAILDFGGGPGISFFHLTRCLNKDIPLSYNIVETKTMCESSEKLYTNNLNVHFYTSIPDVIQNLKIIFISSVLQYIEDYQSLLLKLCSLKSDYIFLAKTSSVEFETYVTKQLNEDGCELPYRFINIQEIIETLEKNNYSLIFKSAHGNIYDQSNFPEKFRMKSACNLLFEKV
jgi:putative methyltransferase (TIGR04325 family)